MKMRNRKVTQLFAGFMVTALVLTGGVVPPTTSLAATKTVTIRTQKELRAALKDPKVTSIVIKTAKGVTFTIKDGDYSDKKLVISSPKATVKNYASFEKIEIRDGNTVYDRGEGNQIVVKDKNELKLVAGKRAADVNITVASQSGKIQIINNAKDSTIVTAADASVVLNQSANLTVAEGTKLEKLEVKADASITVAKGAEVQNIAVSGAAQNVALTVDGALANVSIDSKAAVKVGGSTTTAVAIKNNAEGAAIESAVKTDVTLGANAAISFTEGAEGSTVRSEKAEIKPTVDNKTTDKITVTDAAGKETTIDAGKTSDSGSGTTGGGSSSSGTTGGGSSSGGTTGGGSSSGGTTGGDTSEDNKVTFSVAIDGEGSLDALKAGVKLKATAAATADQAAVFTYEWKLGETVVSTTDSYTIKAEDAGKQLVVTATATINGKQQTFTHTPLPVIKAEYAGNNYVDPALSVENGCSEADVIKQLPDKIMIHDAEKINTAEVTVSWGAINYDAETAGTYRFAGNYQLPETWTGVSSQLTANVTVLEAGALNYTVSVASGFTHNEDSKGTDTLTETNENQAAVTLSGSGYDYTITGSLSKLHSFVSSDAAQGEGKWIGLLIDVGADVKDQLYFGSSESLSVITDYEDQVATANQIILWVKADQLANGAITRYMKYGADGTVVPLTIRFENTDVEIRCFDAIAEINGGTYGSAKEVTDLGLPETVTAYDTKNESHAVKVTWEPTAEYQTDANAGSYEFTAKLADDETVIVPQEVELPKVHVVIAKAENTTTCGDPTVVESQTTANSITLTAVSVEGKTVEYACAKTADEPIEGWQEGVAFTGLDAGTTYYFFARVKEEQNYLAGAASAGVPATTSKISEAVITAMTPEVNQLYVDAGWAGAKTDVADYGTPIVAADPTDATKITITGKLTYVTDFTGFNTANADEQKGHYLTLQFAAPESMTKLPEDVSVTCGNKTFGKGTFDVVNGTKIFSIIYHIKEEGSKTLTITIDWDGENGTEYASTTYTLDIRGLTLSEKDA